MAGTTWNQLCSNTCASIYTSIVSSLCLMTDSRSAITICAALTLRSFVTPILEISLAFSLAPGHESYMRWKPRTSMASACSSVSHSYLRIFSCANLQTTDLHAAPGKQNKDSYSGTSLPPSFFSTRFHLDHTIHVLEVLLHSLKNHTPHLTNIVGIELLNEPQPPSDEALQKWYRTTIQTLRKIDRDIPLVFGECWRPDTYADFIANHSTQGFAGPLILDHHLYRCFTSEDIVTPASAHTDVLLDPRAPTPLTFSRVASKLERAGAGMIVGEWSGALNPGSRKGDDREVAGYVQAQLALYERWCTGWYWWTYKKKCGGGWEKDTGWCFRDAIEGGVFTSWVGLQRKEGFVTNADRKERLRVETGERALREHARYWSQYPGKYEH